MLNTKVVDTKIICIINDFDTFKETIDTKLNFLIPDTTGISKSFMDESIEFIIKTILINDITKLKVKEDTPYLLSLKNKDFNYHYVVAKYSDKRFGDGFSICETMTA